MVKYRVLAKDAVQDRRWTALDGLMLSSWELERFDLEFDSSFPKSRVFPTQKKVSKNLLFTNIQNLRSSRASAFYSWVLQYHYLRGRIFPHHVQYNHVNSKATNFDIPFSKHTPFRSRHAHQHKEPRRLKRMGACVAL
jgi:hypothetical protein